MLDSVNEPLSVTDFPVVEPSKFSGYTNASSSGEVTNKSSSHIDDTDETLSLTNFPVIVPTKKLSTDSNASSSSGKFADKLSSYIDSTDEPLSLTIFPVMAPSTMFSKYIDTSSSSGKFTKTSASSGGLINNSLSIMDITDEPSSSLVDYSAMVPSKRFSSNTRFEKFTLFPNLPAEIRLMIWKLAIDDACVAEPAVCAYQLPGGTAGSGSGSSKKVPCKMLATMHACRESRYEAKKAKYFEYDIDQQTGAWLRPCRPFCPKVDIIYIPFHIFTFSLTESDFPTFLRRNPRGASVNVWWCEECYDAGCLTCHECGQYALQLTTGLLREHKWNPSFLEDARRLASQDVDAREKPTTGNFGLMVQQAEGSGSYRMRTAHLRSGARLLEDMDDMRKTKMTVGKDRDWEFVMPVDFDFTVLRNGPWPY